MQVYFEYLNITDYMYIDSLLFLQSQILSHRQSICVEFLTQKEAELQICRFLNCQSNFRSFGKESEKKQKIFT